MKDNNIRVLFLNRSSDSDPLSQDCKDLPDCKYFLEKISKPNYTLKALTKKTSIEEVQKELENTDILIMWVDSKNPLDSKNPEDWQELDNLMKKDKRTYYLGFIVIFAFQEKENVINKSGEAMLRQIYPFVHPINNYDVFKAYIDAKASEMKYKKSLDDFKKDLLKAKSLDEIVEKALKQLKEYPLKEHPLVGYDRASISLVDRETKASKRYLLKLDSPEFNRSQKLQIPIYSDKSKSLLVFWYKWFLAIQKISPPINPGKIELLSIIGIHNNPDLTPMIQGFEVKIWICLILISADKLTKIAGDKLIRRVDQETVFIIEDLDLHRQDESLKDVYWTDESATRDIKSWIGLAAKYQNETVAIITLDSKESRKYEESSHKLREFMKDFGEIFADAIENFSLKRNKKIIEEIINEMGDDLDREKLIKQILTKLKDELKCDKCSYFSVSYNLRLKNLFLEELISVNNNPEATTEKTEKNKNRFEKGDGIVGAVLEDGKSRIVPHAREDKKFIPSLTYPGDNTSMLAVPVIPISKKNSKEPNRIIGVICCHKEELDHFTVYDRNLVEFIALSAATVIERTMTLELSNKISSKMANLVVDSNVNNLLEKICEYALTVTSAGSASIHLLEHLGENKYRATGDKYTYPSGEESSPRLGLNDKGTTKIAIKKNKTVEFSEKDGFWYPIDPEQKDVNDKITLTEEHKKKGFKYMIVVPLKIKNKDDYEEINGALYLIKYEEEPFSTIEKFALELFASQAASIIYDQKILAENKFRSDAHQDFATAIENIAKTDNTDLLLRNITKYSYSLVQKNISITHPFSNNAMSEYEIKKEWSDYVLELANLVSYVVIFDTGGKPEVKAAWPMDKLTDLQNTYRENENKVITRLVAEHKKTIIAPDKKTIVIDNISITEKNITEENKNIWQEYQKYIKFRNKETNSLLAVPIKDDNDIVIGVINLQHSLPDAFTKLHQEVIEHFAKQIAIAFQKKNFINQIERSNKILTTLHESLSKIMLESPQTMLYRVVSQTREALEAEKVIFVLFNSKQRKYYNPIVSKDEISETIPSRDHDFTRKYLEKYSLDVYRDKNKSNEIKVEQLDSFYGFCLPFSSELENKLENMGVVWILFSNTISKEQLEQLKKDKENVYKVYVNQIALAYENAKRFEQFKKKASDDLIKEINVDYKSVRWHSTFSFGLSFFMSIIAFFLIFGGIYLTITAQKLTITAQKLTITAQKSPNDDAKIAAVAGIILQAVTVLAFKQGKEANDRMDRYHQEIYNVGKLRILLDATEQLEPEIVKEEKQKIIQTTTNSWLQSIKEIENTDKVNQVKNTDNLIKPE